MRPLTATQRALVALFDQGQPAPDGTSPDDCKVVAAWYLDGGQDGVKPMIALQEAARLARLEGK